MQEMGKFNPDIGTITTYFTPYLLHAMNNYIDNEINRSTPYYANIMKLIKEAVTHFKSQHIVPTTSDIAYYTGLSVKKVEDGLQRIQAINEAHYESEVDLDTMLKKSFDGPEEEILKQERTRTLEKALMELNQKDRVIIGMRFGLTSDPAMSFNTIAKELHMPVNQVQNSVNRSLRILNANRDLRLLEGAGHAYKRHVSLDYTEMSVGPDSDILQLYDDIGEDFDAECSNPIQFKKILEPEATMNKLDELFRLTI